MAETYKLAQCHNTRPGIVALRGKRDPPYLPQVIPPLRAALTFGL